jgi:hypothetical protein
MTVDGVSTTGLPFDHPAWRLIHAYYLVAAATQSSEDVREALADDIGDTFEGFIRACADQVIIVSPAWFSDGLHYCVLVQCEDGPGPITSVHASLLRLDTAENEADELAWAMRRRDSEDPPS